MTFTDDLREDADDYWSAVLGHPMVRRLGEGTLDEAPFCYWVRQDYVYLVEFSRVFALGAAKAPDIDRLETFVERLDSTVNTEMELHREHAAEFGISEADLETTEPSPTTQAYTDFLVRTAHGTFGDLIAALLPCLWMFSETGRRLAERGVPDHERYGAWVEMYSGDEFVAVAEWHKSLLDDVAADATADQRDRYRDLFETSARYEYMFWDAAWNEEEWPL
jgi:thiaminase/transcriptional activator TenA